jgi:hypothetical protein
VVTTWRGRMKSKRRRRRLMSRRGMKKWSPVEKA